MSRTVYQVCLLVVASSFLLPLLCFPTSCLGSQYRGCLWDTCGDFEFSYPFGKIDSGCGDPQFQLHCDQNRYPLLNISGDEYLILQPSFFGNERKNRSITIINYNLWKTMFGKECNCSGNYSEFWWPASLFHIAGAYTNLTLWKHCNESIEGKPESFQKWRLCGHDWYSISNPESGRRFCQTNLQLPIRNNLPINQNGDLIEIFGFEITWYVDTERGRTCGACLDSEGRCGYDISKPTTFLCYCPDGTSHSDRCPANAIGPKIKSAIVIGCSFGIVVLTALAVLCLTFYVKRRRPTPGTSTSKVEKFLKEYASEMPIQTRYALSDFEKITNNFPEPK